MACGFDKGLIAAKYDGELTPEERLLVERHLATCADCAADLSSMRELSASLKPLRGASAPMSIAEGVMKEIGPARRLRGTWIYLGVSVAAAVLMAVGTMYMLDRHAAPVRQDTVARLTKEAPAAEPLNREYRAKELPKSKAMVQPAQEPRREEGFADSGSAAKPAAPNPAPPPPPVPTPADPAKPEDEGKGVVLKDNEDPEKKADEPAMALDKDVKKDQKKPATPVMRIASADPVLARAEVDAFLKERKLAGAATAAPFLGRTRMVRDRYLQLELSDEEVKELEKRLSSLKATEVTTGTLEDEKKKVDEEEAKRRNALGARSGDDTMDGDKAEKEAPKAQPNSESTPKMAAKAAVARKKIILVFEPPPAKK